MYEAGLEDLSSTLPSVQVENILPMLRSIGCWLKFLELNKCGEGLEWVMIN
jgi:hypothetical protein